MTTGDAPRSERPDLGPAGLLFRIGLGLLLAALLMLFRYGMVHGWITPEVRVAVGAVGGASLLGVGLRTRRRRPAFGWWMEGTGLAALYLSAFAAGRLYGMTTPTIALVQLVFVSAVAVAISVYEDAEILAAVGLVGALAAPFALPGRIAAFPGDAGYVAIVLVASSVLYVWRRWTVSHVASVLGAGMVMTVELVRHLLDTPGTPAQGEIQLGILVVWASGWLVPIGASFDRRHQDAATLAVPVVASALIPLATFTLSRVLWLGPDDGEIWAAVAIAAGLLHAAVAVLSRRTAPVLARVQAVVALAFVSVAAPLVLEGDMLVVAWAAVGMATLAAGRHLRLVELEYAGHVMSGVAATGWVADLALIERALSPGVVAAGLAVPALWLLVAVDGAPLEGGRTVRRFYRIAAHVGVMVWTAGRFETLAQGAALTTVVWGVLGIAELVGGRLSGWPGATSAGFVTMMVSVAKLLLVDLAAVDPVWRILLFAGFGGALAAVGYWLGSGETSPTAPGGVSETAVPVASNEMASGESMGQD